MTRIRVADIGKRDVAGVQAAATVADAAMLMRRAGVGSAVVFERNVMVGIITERDVLNAALDEVNLKLTPVVAYMSRRPAMIDAGADVSDAALMMLALHARHLPVSDGGRVVGMVSARDLLEAVAHAEADLERDPLHRPDWAHLPHRPIRIAEDRTA